MRNLRHIKFFIASRIFTAKGKLKVTMPQPSVFYQLQNKRVEDADILLPPSSTRSHCHVLQV